VAGVAPSGKLNADGGGDPIPLTRPVLTLGRLKSCDICLRFPNVSSIHCEFVFDGGWWTVRDRDSIKGVKVNGERVRWRVLHPGDTITIGKRKYTIEYTPPVSSHPVG